MLITSAQNPKVKLVRALQTQSKARKREGRTVLEGARLVADVFGQGVSFDFVLHRPDFEAPLLAQLQAGGVECLAVETPLFASLVDTETSQGILAVCPLPDNPLSPQASLLIGLDSLREPNNVGAVYRSVAAAGGGGGGLLGHCADPFSPKALRAGMGAQYRLASVFATWHSLTERLGGQWAIWLAEARAGAHVYSEPLWANPSLVVIGSEAHGLSEEGRRFAWGSVTIPLEGGVESLNAATAAAILLFEARRQRQQSTSAEA